MTGVWIIVVLLLAAMVLILVEMLTPFFGALAVMAMICLIGATWAAFHEFGGLAGAIMAAAILVLTPAYCVLLARMLPKWGFSRKLFLTQPPPAEGGAAGGVPAWLAGLVGKTGKTVTDLRPIGTVIIDGRRYQASADSGYVEQDTPIKVVRFDGMEIIVRAIGQPQQAGRKDA